VPLKFVRLSLHESLDNSAPEPPNKIVVKLGEGFVEDGFTYLEVTGVVSTGPIPKSLRG